MYALSVIVEAAREDDAAAALWDHGTCGVEVKPAAPQRVQLLAYFECAPDPDPLRSALPGAEVAVVPVPEVDWVARFREGFRPFRVGRFLVTPRWESRRPAPDVLVVDPGRAFGTGTAFRPGSFDLVLANLMALLLVDRALEIRALLAPGGALVVSGLLLDDVPAVRDAYAACGTPRERTQGEWAALVFDAPDAFGSPLPGAPR